mmetsp:Transcript_67370/g.195099  ORF Transcript_67370/g.195099 Transcript_67370/m.195099 type:complete len:316 (+) Transcript_67370:75-1022(+)
MVRFLPPQLARLVTLGLQARIHQDGLAPAAVDAGASRALGVAPADPFAVAGGPTGYRVSSRSATAGQMPPKKYQYGVRTAEDERVPAGEALQRLVDGNKRFVSGTAETFKDWSPKNLEALAAYGQNPMASIIGCADSRAPVELLFDAQPGDLFVCRNAGNTLSNAEGSLVGSLEFSVNALGVKLVVFLGHTQCGAIKGATAKYLDSLQRQGDDSPQNILDSLLTGLSPVVAQAELDLGDKATPETIASEAVEVNVFAGIEKLLLYSESIREKVKRGEVQVHGAVFDIATGEVKFLGQHPRLPLILGFATAYKGKN